MKIRLSLQRLTLAFVAGMVLFAQITGLHHHLHAEAGAALTHPAELHFEDSGLHTDDHQGAEDFATSTHHSHTDIELKALDDALAKLAANLLPAGLLLAVLRLLLPQAVLRLQPRAYAAPTLKATSFSLRPPANGPPDLHLIAI